MITSNNLQPASRARFVQSRYGRWVDSTNPPLAETDLWAAICRRKFVILLIFGSIFIATIYFTLKTKPEYLASAEIIVEPSSEKTLEYVIAGLNFASSNLRSTSISPRITNYVEILKSKALAQKVIENYPECVAADADHLRQGLSVKNFRETDVIAIQYQSPDPDLSVQLANAYAQTFQKYQLDLTCANIRQVREFIEAQLQTQVLRLDSAERALQSFKQKHKIFSLADAAAAQINQLAAYETMLQQTIMERKTAEEQLNHLLAESNLPKAANQFASGNLFNTLQRLEIERTNLLLQGFEKTHPRILELERQIQLLQATCDLPQASLPLDGSIRQVVQTISDLQMEHYRLKTKEEFISNLVSNYETKLTQLPERERELAKLIRQVEVNRSVYLTLSQRYEEAKIAEASRMSQVRIIGLAEKSVKVKPNLPLNISLGFILATILAIAGGLGIEYFDNTLKTRDDVEKILPVLATIPKLLQPACALPPESAHREKGTIRPETHEAFFVLRTALLYSQLSVEEDSMKDSESEGKILLITSPGSGEGKSTIATNLAIVLASANYKTLLIDADLRKPTLHTIFSGKNYPGFTDVVVRSLDDAIRQTPVSNLWLLTSGTLPPSPADILNSKGCSELLIRLKQTYDFIIIDTPPVLVAADASILAAKVDGVLLTVKANQTTKETLLHSQKVLLYSRANILGAVVNYVKTSKRYGYYYYDRYKYQSRLHKAGTSF